MWQKIKPTVVSCFISLLVGGVFALSLLFWPMERMEWLTYDWRFSLRYWLGHNPEVRKDIIFLDIDDRALKQLGSFPLPREYYAEALWLLSEANVEGGGKGKGKPGQRHGVVGLDIFFTEDSVGKVAQKDINQTIQDLQDVPVVKRDDKTISEAVEGMRKKKLGDFRATADRLVGLTARRHGHVFFPTFLETEIHYLGRAHMEREINHRAPEAKKVASLIESSPGIAALWDSNRQKAVQEMIETYEEKQKYQIDTRLLDILGRQMVADEMHNRIVGRFKSILKDGKDFADYMNREDQGRVDALTAKLKAAGLTDKQIEKADFTVRREFELDEYWGFCETAYRNQPPQTFVEYLETTLKGLRDASREAALAGANELPATDRDRDKLIREFSRPTLCEYETVIAPYADIDYGLRHRISRLRLREAVDPATDSLSHSPTANAPILPMLESSRLPSFVQIMQEVDGVVRRFPLLMIHLPPDDLLAGKRGVLYPALGLALAADVLGVEFGHIVVNPGQDILLPSARDPLDPDGEPFDLRIPIDEHGRMLINWVAPWVAPNDFAHVSLGDLLERDNQTGELTPLARERAKLFKDSVALIGLTGTGTHDMNPTPLQARYPLVGAHGNVLNTILTRQFINKAPLKVNVLILLGVSLVLGLALAHLVRLWSLLGMIVFAAGYFVLAYWMFEKHGYWMDVAHVGGAIFAITLSLFIYRYMTEERRRKQYRGVLQYYLTPDVVNELLKNPDAIKLGGEKRELTAFFSDIEKFSTISEKIGDPAKLVQVMTRYFDVMCAPLYARKGTIDKFIGDAIVAFWNAPVSVPDHAVQACYAALEAKDAEIPLREQLVAEGYLPFKTRIGINTGEMTYGNIGSSTKFNYTILGDGANLASRLEGANKPFHTYIMIGERTYELAKDHIEVRELDRVVVVGKTQPVRVYELISKKGKLVAPWSDALELFEKARMAYLKREFEKAAALFAKLLEVKPADGPAEVYAQRCRVLLMKSPPPDWDGTTRLTEK